MQLAHELFIEGHFCHGVFLKPIVQVPPPYRQILHLPSIVPRRDRKNGVVVNAKSSETERTVPLFSKARGMKFLQ